MARRRPSKADGKMEPLSQLGICLLLDVVGAATYFLPGVGELFDVVYAPIQATVAWSFFGGESWGKVWTGVALAEELLPFFDIFPSMTVGWMMKYLL